MSEMVPWTRLLLSTVFLACALHLNQVDSFSQNQDGTWTTLNATGDPNERHENGFIAYDGKLYLVGGRSLKRVQIFDPQSNTWTNGAFPPFQMHHFQAIVHNDLIYVIGAYTGTCCDMETGISHVWTYNPRTNNWTERDEIPQNRRRGSAGAVVYNNKIYIVGGLEGGHGTGSTSYNWFDEYDPATGQWKILPNAPRNRDHFHAIVHDGKLYLTGGRDTSDESIIRATTPQVDVYDFSTGSWSTLPTNLPTARGGTTSVLYRGEILVIGGESGAQTLAFNLTEALDPINQTWRTLPALNVGRHGTQATILDDAVYIAAGAAQVGGTPELDSIERYEDGTVQVFTYNQLLNNGWNMVGLPLLPFDDFYLSVYDSITLTEGISPMTWNGSSAYEASTQLQSGVGYWLNLEDDIQAPETQVVTGTLINSVLIELSPGWNMISGPSCNDIPIFSESTSPEGAVQAGLTYYYDTNRYVAGFNSSFPRGIIQRGVGYWVHASSQAVLSLDCNSNKQSIAREAIVNGFNTSSDFGTLTISDQNLGRQTLYFGASLKDPTTLNSFQMPPLGPTGSFDARFTTNRRLIESDQGYVQLQASQHPLSLTFDRLPQGRDGTLTVEELDYSGTTLHTHLLLPGTQLDLLDKRSALLNIQFDGTLMGEVPDQLVLQGNFPNPFSTTTRINVNVPQEGDIHVSIFDLLGREVMSKYQGNITPGINRSIYVSAQFLPPGIYMYRVLLETPERNYIASGRMVVLRP